MFDEPRQALGRTVGAVAGKIIRLQAEAILRPFEHGASRAHFGLANGARGFEARHAAMRRIATSTEALKSGSPWSDFPPERQSRATFGCLNNGKESYAVSVPRTSRSAFLSSPNFRSLAADPSKHSKRTPSLASFSSRINGRYASFMSFSIASS